jgi:hypothetical protein
MPNPRLRNLMALFSLLSMAPLPAFACSCISLPSAVQDAKQSDRVFLGRVTAIRRYESSDFVMWVKDRLVELGDALGTDWHRDYGQDFRQEVTLQVIETFKGDSAKELVITTGFGGGDCGVPFDKNDTYLVFARHLKDPDELVTGICDGTDKATNRRAELRALRAGI